MVRLSTLPLRLAEQAGIAASGLRKPHSVLYYVHEGKWSTMWDARYITGELNRQNLLKAYATTRFQGIRNQIVHFGSRNLFLPHSWERVDGSNRIVFTWFHGTEEDHNPGDLAMIRALPQASEKANIVHTSCQISRENLIRWNVPEKKIAMVPVGVDLKLFKPVEEAEKKRYRNELGLPDDKLIIASFQKDGVGWGDGMEPKWVKGPDIFARVVQQLRRSFDILVLLAGPARGYIRAQLEKNGMSYKHVFLKDYTDIPILYNVSDLYLVTSRAEGGPKAITEAMATGVPIVTTKVGIATEVVTEGYNGFVCETDDVEALVAKAGRILANKELASRLATRALTTVKDYSWENVARQFYDRIYGTLVGSGRQ